MAVTAAANNKFIAADEVHKLIITSRATHLAAAAAAAGVPVQTITDDLQHNGPRLTDTDLLSRDYSRVRAVRLRPRLTYVRLPASSRKLQRRFRRFSPSSQLDEGCAVSSFAQEYTLTATNNLNICMHGEGKVASRV